MFVRRLAKETAMKGSGNGYNTLEAGTNTEDEDASTYYGS
jgi:hypothetical protein